MRKVCDCLLLGAWVLLAQGEMLWGQQASVRADKESLVAKVLEVSATGNRIKVLHAPLDSRLEIYGIVGEKVLEIELRQSSGEYEVELAKGCYIVKIGETVRKIFIR